MMIYNNLAVIQARLNSKRLKNKMILKVGGYPILYWVLKRISLCKLVDKIVVAIPKDDTRLIPIIKKFKFDIIYGDEINVLSRYKNVCNKFKYKNIIRICADNPLVDPLYIDFLIKNFKNNKYHYAYNHMNIGNDSHINGFGAEILTFETMNRIILNAKSQSEKEHITKYIWDNKKAFNIQKIGTFFNQDFPYLNFDIDNKSDLYKIDNFIRDEKIIFTSNSYSIIEKYFSREINFFLIKLFPIKRSIMGNGNRKTLNYIKNIIPISTKEIKSGKKFYDWQIPKEWKIDEAWIKNSRGKKIIDIKDNFLHIVSYSKFVNKKFQWNEIKDKIHFLRNQSNAIPYRTSYYNNDWGFCVNKKQYHLIKKESKPFLNVKINSKFFNGSLSYGEIFIKGKTKKEILISCYICHPNIANDGLSGIVLTTYLAQYLQHLKNLQWSYRIIFIPETIGAVAYCKINKKSFKNIMFGLLITCVGGKGPFGYKQSWDNTSEINRLVEKTFKKEGIKYKKYKFDIHGSDERQFSSNGFRLNTISITKDKYYEYPFYHNSKDNLDFVNGSQIYESFKIYKSLINKIENLKIYKNNIYCEPMLFKHNLSFIMGGSQNPVINKNIDLDKFLWFFFYCDGIKSEDFIRKKINMNKKNFEIIKNILLSKKIIKLI